MVDLLFQQLQKYMQAQIFFGIPKQEEIYLSPNTTGQL